MDQLRAAGVAEPEADARALFSAVTMLTALDLVREPGWPLSPEQVSALEASLRRRLAGEPIGRILGRRSFWGLDFALSPATLEPRHDSEAVVEEALARLGPDTSRPLRLLDIGTGTGCLLLALLHERPAAVGLGVDLSPDAARTAARNAAALGLADRALIVCGRWTEAARGPFDLIVSNPPYIPRADVAALAREVREHDPLLALDGGADGLDAYRAILPMARPLLAADGALVLEIGAGQADEVEQIATEAGYAPGGRRADLGGHARALCFLHS
jgi:release factor glutamine methyltransferase